MKAYKILSFLLLATTLYSCQKVIKVNTKTAPSKYVIEGNITDESGPYTVKVTRSINIDQDNTFPAVSGALVVVIDSTTGYTDTLTEMSAGIYQTHGLAGSYGHTYKLSVTSGTDVFTSSSTMPNAIALDTLYTQKSQFGGDDLEVVPEYTDPVGKGNSFHFVLTKEDTVSKGVFLFDDQIVDGKVVKTPLFSEFRIIAGDSITVEIQAVDINVGRYYNDLGETVGQNSASPANPRSNINGGCLGYFSAHTVYRRSIIAE